MEVFVVAVGTTADMAEVNGIASDPDNTHVVRVRNAQEVERGAEELADILCA